MPDKISIPANNNTAKDLYDVLIIGGGLAGLSLSILLAKQGHKVALFEKETYPFHKVCGEYISLESWDFLESLGIPLSEMNLPIIRKLMVSAPNGKYLEQMLPLGGFGISRYTLDAMLAEIACSEGVSLFENTRVNQVISKDGMYEIETSWGNFTGRVAAGAFGKKSNLDTHWKRKFTLQKPNKLNNYIAVKYHIQIDHPAELIALHNFDHGYCGISSIEDGKCCLCYLTTAKNLNQCGNNIGQLEKQVLSVNPFLNDILHRAVRLYDNPEIISQISFARKNQIENNIFLLGDAAGMITPLCGNGMSMALQAGKMAAAVMDDFLTGNISLLQAFDQYTNSWQSAFHRRLTAGRMIQRFFGHPALTSFTVDVLKRTPFIVNKLVRATHGNPF